MIEQFGTKSVQCGGPIAVAASGTLTAATIDTFGYEYMRVTVDLGVTDGVPSTMKLQQSDAANMSGAVDVPGTVFGTDLNDTGVASTFPLATDDNQRFVFLVDLRGKKRYMKLIFTMSATGTTGLVSAWAELSRPHESPVTAVAAGCKQRMVA